MNNQTQQVFTDPSGKRWGRFKALFIICTVLIIIYLISIFNLYQTVRTKINFVNNDYRTQQGIDSRISVRIFPDKFSQSSFISGNFEQINNIICDCSKIDNNDQRTKINVIPFQELSQVKTLRSNSLKLIQELILAVNLDQISSIDNIEVDEEFFTHFDEFLINVDQINSENKVRLLKIQNTLARRGKTISFVYTKSSLNKVQEILAIPELKDRISKVLYKPEVNSKFFSSIEKELKDLSGLVIPRALFNIELPSGSYLLTGPKNSQKLESIYQKTITDPFVDSFDNNNRDLIYSPEYSAFRFSKGDQTYLMYNDVAMVNLVNRLSSYGLMNKVNSITLDNVYSNNQKLFKDVNLKSNSNIAKENFKFNDYIDNSGTGGLIRAEKGEEGKRILIKDEKGIYSKIEIQKLPKNDIIKYSGGDKKQVSISFDDGPDPSWTAKVLDILKEKNVKATFYLVGLRVAKNPEIVRRIVDEGHAVANHTYTNSRLTYISEQGIIEEIKKNQEVIEQVSGIKPKYFRTPYNVFSTYERNTDSRVLDLVNSQGLILSEADTDPLDLKETSNKDSILNFAINNTKSQLLLHDNYTADKQGMLDALPLIIDNYKSKGVEMVTVETLDNQTTTIPQKKSWFEPPQTEKSLLQKNLDGINLFILIITIISVILLVLIRILWLLQVVTKKEPKSQIDFKPPVSIVIPAYNESKVIVSTVNSLLNQKYHEFEIIIVNDGSKDNTLELVQSSFGKNKKIRIIDKPNGGKASSLNEGIKESKFDFILFGDADTQFSEDAIEKMINYFIDPKVGAVAGNVQVGNDYFTLKSNGVKNPKFNFLPIFQRIEYIISQNFFREAFDKVNIITIVSGAIGLYRKSAIIEVGGISEDTLAEDGNLSFDVLRSGWKIHYEKDAMSYTEVPETLRELYKQRFRWAYGNIQVLWKNKDVIFNRKYGFLGFISVPFSINCIFGTLTGPIFTLVFLVTFLLSSKAYNAVRLNEFSFNNPLLFIAIFISLEIIVLALALYRDRSPNKWILIPFFVLQLMFFSIFFFVILFDTTLKAVKGKAQGWNHLDRSGTVSIKT